jgi:hypothetical protein
VGEKARVVKRALRRTLARDLKDGIGLGNEKREGIAAVKGLRVVPGRWLPMWEQRVLRREEAWSRRSCVAMPFCSTVTTDVD